MRRRPFWHSLPLLLPLIWAVTPTIFAAWPGVAFKELRAYAWSADGDPVNEVVLADGKLRPGVLNPKGALLSKAQVRRVLTAQRNRVKLVNGRRIVSGCYNPHNAFVFLDKAGRIVAFLEVCFDCHNARLMPADEQSEPNLIALAEICAELKLSFGEQKSLAELRKVFRAAGGKE